jgi:hypothetical protein
MTGKRAAKQKVAAVRMPNTRHKEHVPNVPKRKPHVKVLPERTGAPSNEKGTVGRVTPKKTGLFGSATLGKKTKTAALKKGVRKTIAKKGL